MVKKVVWYVLLFIVIQYVAVGLVFLGNLVLNGKGVTLEQISSSTTQMLLVQGIFGVACVALFLGFRWTPVSEHYWNTKPFSVIFWCIIAAVGTIAPSMWLQSALDFLPDFAGEELLDFIQHRWGYLVICILTPLAEEVIFRGAVLRTMLEHWEGRKRWTAIIISALLFGLAHMNPAQIPHAFLMGVLLGWLYERSRSLIPCVVLHCANNTIAYLMTAAYPAPDITLRDVLGGSQRAEWMAIAFSLMILVPALYQLSLRLKR
ncbi:MAG: CPBP family intramembrane metalloprotease [Prevotella sp.]|nr:CPBP family intramembrane metalloprotease [Prevotella sp.]